MKTSSRFCFLCRLFWAVVVFLMNRNLCECASLFLFTSYGLCSEKSHCFTFLGIRTAVKTHFVFQNKCLIADLQILGKRGERRIKCDQSTLKCYIGKA